MKSELQNVMEKPKRADSYDGTGEMVFGLMALSYGLLGYVQVALPKNSIWRQGSYGKLLFFAGVLLMLGLMIGVTKVIKKRITWPRTGYVKYRNPGRKFRWAFPVAVGVFSAVIAAGLAWLMWFDRRHDWMSLVWMGNVLLYAAGYVYWIYRMERDRPWKWLVLLFMALGLLTIALIAPAGLVGLGQLMLLFVGMVWLGSGGATLYLFIRHNQPPVPEIE